MFDALALSKRKASQQRRRKAYSRNVKLYESQAELAVYFRLIELRFFIQVILAHFRTVFIHNLFI
jgi:hypothetical protein